MMSDQEVLLPTLPDQELLQTTARALRSPMIINSIRPADIAEALIMLNNIDEALTTNDPETVVRQVRALSRVVRFLVAACDRGIANL